MDLQQNDKSYQALTVGSLNVLQDINSPSILSLNTHLEVTDSTVQKQIARMDALYKQLSDDGVISVNEKLLLKKELNIIITEYPTVLKTAQEAKKDNIKINAYKTAFKNLNKYLFEELKIFDEMDKPLNIEREIFNKKFADYYKARNVLAMEADGNEALSYPTDQDKISHLNFDETVKTNPSPNPAYSSWQSKIIEYDCTGKTEIEMSFEEALNDVIILSGTIDSDFTFKPYFDITSGNGSKKYQFVYKLKGNNSLTITSGVDGSQKILTQINEKSFGSGCYAVVDRYGNIWRFKGGASEIGLGELDLSGTLEDDDYFLVKQNGDYRKAEMTTALKKVQEFDSPLGEIKIFYENKYKHGFLECNGLPFSPSVFPELTEYVKRVFNTEVDQITGWQLRPNIIKDDGTKIFIKAVQGV